MIKQTPEQRNHLAGPGGLLLFKKTLVASLSLAVAAVLLAALAGALLLAQPAQADAPAFATRSFFGPGDDKTRAIVVGDLDADGDLDIVAGNEGEPNVAYLNDGKGGFPLAGARPLGGEAAEAAATRSLGLADLDGDGDLDVIATADDAQARLYFNDGAGNFPAAAVRVFPLATFITPTAPISDTEARFPLGVGDLDGDTDYDLVIGGAVGDAIYLNDGHGFFTATLPFPLDAPGTPAAALALADLDRDGDVDIVSAAHGQRPVIHWNDGNLVITATQTITHPLDIATMIISAAGALLDIETDALVRPVDEAWAILVDDVNNDGLPDIIVADTKAIWTFWNRPDPQQRFTQAPRRAGSCRGRPAGEPGARRPGQRRRARPGDRVRQSSPGRGAYAPQPHLLQSRRGELHPQSVEQFRSGGQQNLCPGGR